MKGEKSVRLTECPHPQPLSHPMGEGGVGLSPLLRRLRNAEREEAV